MHLKYKFCAMVASHPNLQWQLLTNMLLKKELFFKKELGVSHFSMDLPKVALAYEGVDWIATWIFFK
jgi:hypothetical protein